MIITRTQKVHEGGSTKERKYKVIKEYPRYYLCECIFNGKPLYKECFLKVDINKIIPVDLDKWEPRVGWLL